MHDSHHREMPRSPLPVPGEQEAPGTPSRLTPRQRTFLHHYLVCRNAAEAARRAGYSARTADRQGHRLLRNAEVRAEIERIEDEAADRLVARHQELCIMLSRIIRTNIGDVVDADGRLRPGALTNPATADAIRFAGRDPRTGNWRVQLHDKIAAIALLSRLMGWDRRPPGSDSPPPMLVLPLERW